MGMPTALRGQHFTLRPAPIRGKESGYARLIFSDYAKEAVLFVRDSSSEKDSARLREKIPQAIKLKRCAVGAHERLDKRAGSWIVIVDQAVTEVTDPEFVALHQSKSPRSIEIPV